MSNAADLIDKYNNSNVMMGCGSYAAVFKSSFKDDLVVKIGITRKDSCFDYYKTTSNINSIHKPVVHKIFEPEDYYICQMECLDKASVDHYKVISLAEAYLKEKIDEYYFTDRIKHCLRTGIPDIRKFLDYLDFLINNKPANATIDLHQNNCMLRDNSILVITDPWYNIGAPDLDEP